MATQSPTAAGYGFPAPQGSSLIRDGDDAIVNLGNSAAGLLAELFEGKVRPPLMPTGTDWDNLRASAVYSLPSAGRNYANGPTSDPVGYAIVTDARNSTGNVQHQIAVLYNPTRIMFRGSNTAGVWGAWQQIARDDPDYIDGAAGRRAAVVDAGLRRRGRRIGTGGRAAVALRFDHHLGPFRDKVLPLLAEFRLPWGQMLNAGNMGTGADTMSAAEVTEACQNTGGEVWNHSWSHSDIITTSQADREITLGLSDLRAMFPALWIDGWAPPGQPTMLGMEGTTEPAKLWGTYPGRLILAQHAFIRASYAGIYTGQQGAELIGQAHTTIDQQNPAYVAGILNGAQRSAAGVTLMLHPNYLDQSGYLTTAQLREILEDIADRRDAGALHVLTPTGVLLADKTTSDRRNLLTLADAGTISSSWSQTVTTRAAAQQYGVPHEASAYVRASSAGTVRLRVEITHAGGTITQSHTINAAAGSVHRLGVPVTPPMTTTQTVITLTGALTHTGIHYGAV